MTGSTPVVNITFQSSLKIPVIPNYMIYIMIWFGHSCFFSSLAIALCHHLLLLPLILSTSREFLFY